ncbi:MAG TPA: PEP-CTERM sorting domain-containing protein [Humisphaera sp.]
MTKTKQAVALFSAILGTAGLASAQSVPSSGFFDWSENTNPTAPDFTASPFLDNNNATQVAAQLSAAQAAGKPLAVKVREPLTNPASQAIFNQFAVKYVFCDFEDAALVGRTRAVADLVLSSTASKNAFVGNFNVYPNSGSDGTRPVAANTNYQYGDIRGKTPTSTGKLMSNEQLYPGQSDFRTGGTSQLPIPGGTPNIRSGLFTLPIIRQTVAENSLPGSDAHIPWVTRFNNWGNTLLDTDGNSSNGYQFVQNASNPANGQLLSRGDFQAQILHYRLRGADSVNLFQASAGSVQGYSRAQEQSDIRTGWGGSAVVNGIFSRNNFALANLTTVIGDRGGSSGDPANSSQNPTSVGPRGLAVAGAAWSGVYDKSGSTRKLSILISNMGTDNKTIDLPNFIGGYHAMASNGSDDFAVSPGQHRLLTFTLKPQSSLGKNMSWVLDSNVAVFTDNNRNGVGIPEPTSAAVLGLGAVGLLAARRRRKA